MASLTLITIACAVNVLAISIQTCNCGLSPSPAHLYTQALFPSKRPAHGSVIYVPSSVLGYLPLENHGHNYNLQLDKAASSYLLQSGKGFADLSAIKGVSSYRHLNGVSHKDYQSGSATVYQKNDHHSSEQKQQIQHAHGVSHQTIKHEHQQGYQDASNQVHDHGYDELHQHKKDHDAHYQFEYYVNDQKTGDVKRHREERKGDVVNGEYSLLEEDGNVRTVKYYADWKSGFHAQVHNTKPRIK